MKVYINKYKNHWISPYTICEKICFWREIDYDEPWVKRTNKILSPVMQRFQSVWNFFDPKIDYVKIDYWDTWSMDHTLAHIVVPMLKQIRDGKMGYPLTDDEDAPDEFSSVNNPADDEYNWDKGAEDRWNWIINEMIWAFEQQLDDDAEDKFYDHSESMLEKDFNKRLDKLKVDREGLQKHWDRKKNGFRLFGKYYECLWQ
jgi:hypothetical protein